MTIGYMGATVEMTPQEARELIVILAELPGDAVEKFWKLLKERLAK